jgi:hypothetical protein
MADCEGCMGVYTFHDGTGTMIPDPSAGAEGQTTAMDACSPNVLCIEGTTAFEHWGSGFRMDFAHSPGANDYNRVTRDLTGYRGVGFWGLLLEGVAAMKVGFPDPNTDPASGTCFDATVEIPIWEENVGREPSEKMQDCENDWGKSVLLEKNKWVYYEITFDQIAISPHWGVQVQDQGLLQDQVYAVKFQREPTDLPYAICIDELVLLPN